MRRYWYFYNKRLDASMWPVHATQKRPEDFRSPFCCAINPCASQRRQSRWSDCKLTLAIRAVHRRISCTFCQAICHRLMNSRRAGLDEAPIWAVAIAPALLAVGALWLMRRRVKLLRAAWRRVLAMSAALPAAVERGVKSPLNLPQNTEGKFLSCFFCPNKTMWSPVISLIQDLCPPQLTPEDQDSLQHLKQP